MDMFNPEVIRKILEDNGIDSQGIAPEDLNEGIQIAQQQNPQADAPTLGRTLSDYVKKTKPELVKRSLAGPPDIDALYDTAQERIKQRMKKSLPGNILGTLGSVMSSEDPTKFIEARRAQITEEEQERLKAHLQQKIGDPARALSQYQTAAKLEGEGMAGELAARRRDPNSQESFESQQMVKTLGINFDPTGMSAEAIEKALPHGLKLQLAELKAQVDREKAASIANLKTKKDEEWKVKREVKDDEAERKRITAATELQKTLPAIDGLFQLSQSGLATGPISGTKFMVEVRKFLGDQGIQMAENLKDTVALEKFMEFAQKAGVRAIDTPQEQQRVMNALLHLQLTPQNMRVVAGRLKSYAMLAMDRAEQYNKFLQNDGKPSEFFLYYHANQPEPFVNPQTGDVVLVRNGEQPPPGFQNQKQVLQQVIPDYNKPMSDQEVSDLRAGKKPKPPKNTSPKQQEQVQQIATNPQTGEKLVLKDGKWVPFEGGQ